MSEQTCTHICKKSFWLLALVSVALYSLDYFSADLGEGLRSSLVFFEKFKFFFVLLTVAFLFKPKWGLLGKLFWLTGAVGVLTTYTGMTSYMVHEGMGFEIGNVPGLMAILSGLFYMLSMPRIDLWKKVIAGLIVGILLGFQLENLDIAFYSEYTKLLGGIFIDLILMIVTPLIFFSLVSGINTISDTEALGRVGKKALFCYLFTSFFAISVGIILGEWIEPGVGLFDTAGGVSGKEKYELPMLLHTFLAIIPDNAVGAIAGTEIVKIGGTTAEAKALAANLTIDLKPNTIQTVFFAMFVGVALVIMGPKAKQVADICHDAAQLMFKIIGFIVNLAPLAVFGLMAWVAATLGTDALIKLSEFVGATILGMGIHYLFIVFVIFFIMRLNPIQFIKKSIEYQMIAFSTTSSKATLATSMDVSQRKLGISKPITSFILPLGASVNMDGTAIYLGLSALFFAQAYGVPLEFYHYILIIFTSTIAAVGAAGFPGGSLVVMTLVLGSIGVPAEGIALIIGVDRILDMFRTTVNITSDVAITMFIDKSEGSFSKELYNIPGENIHDDPDHLEPLAGSRKDAIIAASPDIAPKPLKKKAPAKKKASAKKKATKKKSPAKKK